MALPTTGPLSLNQIHVEAGNSSGTTSSLNSSSIRVLLNPDKGVNQTNSISEYRGASRDVTFTYEIIGGGGGGGYGLEDNAGSGRAGNGGTSSISGSGFTTITASGAQGGRNGHVAYNSYPARAGDSSVYGTGGTGGNNGYPGGNAPSTSYGAGGGGGGGDQGDGLDYDDGNAGEGGNAASRSTGSVTVIYGTTLTITIGAAGAGSTGGDHRGGNGAKGYVKITINGNVTHFTSSGTMTAQ